jgi:DNA-binding LytR/AlgR family response regulator
MKIRCLLVDDEPPALKVLQSHIGNVSGLEIVGQCRNAIEAMDVLQERQVDVIFLDIRMPKILGTDFVKNLSHPPKIIFTTAYREFALDGYELDVVDYLLKPVSFERFLKTVAKLKKIMGLEMSVQPEEYKANPNAFIYLKVDREMQKILIREIMYIESWKDYVKIFLTTGKNALVKQSISSIEKLLSDHHFTRIHRSYIISVDKVLSYNHMSVNVSGRQIPIGRLYKQQFMELIFGR